MNKKVSIVLPVYNGESRVSGAIESVLLQSYKNLELIIVNDCSTDDTEKVVRRFADNDHRIKVICNKENEKLPSSLNIGFTEASGDYLTWTSDDNSYRKDAILRMVDYLETHSDVDFVYCDFDVVNLDGTYRETRVTLEPDEMRFQNPVGACFLYRKELADRIGEYDPNLFLAEDYEYWIKAYLNGKLHHIPEVLYNYGWHNSSLTITRERQVRHKTYEAKEKHFYELLERCRTQEERNQFFWNMLRLLLDEAEREEIRDKYYNLDSSFKKADIRRSYFERVEKSIVGRILIKAKNLCDNNLFFS